MYDYTESDYTDSEETKGKMNFLVAVDGNEYGGYTENARKGWNKPKNAKRTIRDHRRGKVDKRQIDI